MKSFSNFLISEELPVDDIAGRTKTGRIINKRQKNGKPLSPKDVERLDSARLADIERDSRGKMGEKARKDVVKTQGQEDLINKINKDRTRPITKADKGKFFGKPTGVDVATGKAKYVPPKEIAGRSTYIDPKTNKASEKGIKNYISKARQMRTGSNVPVDSKTTDSIAKIAKSEYTDKINQKYGGKRAGTRPSNQPSLAQVQADIDRKDALEKTNKLKRQNTSSTKVVKQSVISKKIASDTKAYNQRRTSTGTKPLTAPASAPPTPPSGPTPPTGVDVTDLTKKSKVTTGNKLSNQGFKDSGVPPQPPKPKASSKITGNKAWQHLAKQGKLDTYKKPATVMTKGMKSYKQFLTKTPKPLRSVVKGGGKVVGKALGPAFAAVDAIGNYQGYKKQGYGTTGSIVRSGAKTGAYWGGYAAGAAKGAALGSFAGPVGTVVGGIAGGILGGGLAGKVADWGIGAYDKVFGGKKLKALKQSNIAKDLKANPWKAYGGKTPQISKNKTKFDQGSFRTVQLKKAKDGSYIMPKGWKKNTGEGSRLSKTTRLTA